MRAHLTVIIINIILLLINIIIIIMNINEINGRKLKHKNLIN